MRIRTYAAAGVLAVLALTGCSDDGSDAGSDAKPTKPAAAKDKPDCGPDSQLDQAEWMQHCADAAEQPADGKLKAGQAYTWPDGLRATVLKAEPLELNNTEPGNQPFRLHIRFENTGQEPLDLGDFSTFVEGATNGGEAGILLGETADGAEEITGRVAPGVTVTKTEDLVIETKYGAKLIVALQYGEPDTMDGEYPEATVTIK